MAALPGRPHPAASALEAGPRVGGPPPAGLNEIFSQIVQPQAVLFALLTVILLLALVRMKTANENMRRELERRYERDGVKQLFLQLRRQILLRRWDRVRERTEREVMCLSLFPTYAERVRRNADGLPEDTHFSRLCREAARMARPEEYRGALFEQVLAAEDEELPKLRRPLCADEIGPDVLSGEDTAHLERAIDGTIRQWRVQVMKLQLAGANEYFERHPDVVERSAGGSVAETVKAMHVAYCRASGLPMLEFPVTRSEGR